MLEHELEDLRAVLEDMPESVAIYELDAAILYFNGTTERMFNKTLAQARGQRLFDLFPEARGNVFHRAFEHVAANGGTETFEHYYAPWDAWLKNRVSRVGSRIHVIARDVTEDVRRRRRLETLARIAELLTGEELDFSSVTERIARLLAEVLEADCSLALLSGDGLWLELCASQALRAEARPPSHVARWDARTGHPGEALRTRCAVLAQAEGLALAAAQVDDPELRAAIQRYGPVSVLVVPLLVGEEAVGVLLAARRVGDRPLTEDDRALGTSIAPSLGLYLANARRQAEAASLRQRLAHLADALPALVGFVDRDERYQYVNAGYGRWFNTAHEAFIGRTLREVAPPAMYERIAPYVRQALAGVSVRFHGRFEYPTGTRDVDVQYVPISGTRGVEGFALLVQDLTAERRVAALEREQLDTERHTARRLESLLELAGKLAAASRPDEIARVVVDEGVEALDAAMAGMFVLSPDRRELVLLRERGFSAEQAAAFSRVPVVGGGPLSDAINDGRPIWVASREEYAARYPSFEPQHRPLSAPPLAFAVMPFFVEGLATGCLSFVFHDERRLTAAERTYLEVLASHSAEAFRRAHLWTELRDVSDTREAMIQASPAAIVLLGTGGIVHTWNRAAEQIFGWPAAEVIGRVIPLADLHPEEFYRNLERVLAGDVIQRQEVRRQRATGEWFDMELYAAPIHLSEGRSMCLGIVVDITDRKRAERGRQLLADANAALTRSLDLPAALADVVRVPLANFADFCSVDLLKDGALERVALSKEDVALGVTVPRRVTHEPDRGGVSLAIETRQPQSFFADDEAALQRLAPGQEHLAAIRSLGMRGVLSVPLLAGDRVLGAVSFGSTTKNFDELDTGIATELARYVATAVENARLFEDAQRARSEAEAASRTKDEFLAMLGHELRNPLAPNATALELMRLREPDRLTRERESVARQVEHLSRLVDDLLDVSRITRGQVELRREQLPLAGIVARGIEMARPLLESRRHRLTVDVPASLAVYADATRLAQVIANLLSNSAKYTPPGGHIQVRASAGNTDVTISVRDDGVGISADMVPRIFDIFVQAPQPSARTEGGLGIGLAIVKSLVLAHGGHVEARSAGLGQGAELILSLPSHAGVSAAAPRATAPGPGATSKRRILVVDDNEDGADLLSELLATYGHEVVTAYDGPSALRLAEQFRPEVAILDLGLPVMDGFELAEKLRAAGPLRLIAVTGYGRDSDRERTVQAGFDAHLAKPVSLEALLPLLELA